MIRDAQDLADELAAEQGYLEMLAHPETVVAAPDLFGPAPFDLCDGYRHYRVCGVYHAFQACPVATDRAHVHLVDDGGTAYRTAGRCPELTETNERADHPCQPAGED